jgi:hypothetical protein
MKFKLMKVSVGHWLKQVKGMRRAMGLKETKGMREMKVTKVMKGTKAMKGTKGKEVTKGTKEMKEMKGMKAMKETKATKETRAMKVFRLWLGDSKQQLSRAQTLVMLLFVVTTQPGHHNGAVLSDLSTSHFWVVCLVL